MGTGGTRRVGFTLIELLVAIAIIGIIIAIIVPALGGARQTARAAATSAQLNELANAAQQFETDTTRPPGYFSARVMGDSANENRGFTAMENVMLDLAGGIVEPTGTGLGGAGSQPVIQVGPTTDNTVDVRVDLIGTEQAGGGYYTPDDALYVAQNGPGAGTQVASVTEHADLPDLVDAFRTPILAWQLDRTAIQPVDEPEDFVLRAAPAASDSPARFYWASNAGFLRTENLGKRGKVVPFQTPGAEYSLVGEGVPDARLQNHLMVMLGSPTVPSGTTPPDVYPSAARGALVFQSAGIDAMYMGSQDRGAGGASSDAIIFWRQFYTDGGDRITDSDGKVETIDLLDAFDDIIQTAGN